jgi:hypothetical protein
MAATVDRLFIGGPFHGQFLLADDSPTVRVVEPVTVADSTYPTPAVTSYLLKQVDLFGGVLRAYAHESIAGDTIALNMELRNLVLSDVGKRVFA